ncbi:MAG TPA: CHRD domain-containing protein [Candidatus Sulfotelmatobacter sp.]|nr:CHRD domain-containing protein [Candidatus Sulfotelmatobacter sp.]
MSLMRFSLAAAGVFVAAITLSACESMPMIQTAKPARVVEMEAALTAAKEVPPKASSAEGYAFMSYNEATRALSWKVYYSGLTGPATAAHFHGPAAPTANAGVAINLGAAGSSPIVGSATLTEAQADDLAAGKWYINVHTQANPGGEIRGQVMPDAW